MKSTETEVKTQWEKKTCIDSILYQRRGMDGKYTMKSCSTSSVIREI